MKRHFRFDPCPFDETMQIYDKGGITLSTGITVLVGCNGAGKTTLLQIIKSTLNKKDIPVLYLNTLREARDSIGNAIMRNNLGMAAMGFTASEGEKMHLSVGQFAAGIRPFLMTGKPDKGRNPFASLFEENEKPIVSKERWILIDSADSGMSIDNLDDINGLLDLIVEDAQNMDIDLYIIISTNQYELAKNRKCLNVQTLRPVSIKTYNKYRSVIMASRKRKDARSAS